MERIRFSFRVSHPLKIGKTKYDIEAGEFSLQNQKIVEKHILDLIRVFGKVKRVVVVLYRLEYKVDLFGNVCVYSQKAYYHSSHCHCYHYQPHPHTVGYQPTCHNTCYYQQYYVNGNTSIWHLVLLHNPQRFILLYNVCRVMPNFCATIDRLPLQACMASAIVFRSMSSSGIIGSLPAGWAMVLSSRCEGFIVSSLHIMAAFCMVFWSSRILPGQRYAISCSQAAGLILFIVLSWFFIFKFTEIKYWRFAHLNISIRFYNIRCLNLFMWNPRCFIKWS